MVTRSKGSCGETEAAQSDSANNLKLESIQPPTSVKAALNTARPMVRYQGAHDIRAYDAVKDIQRVEQFVTGPTGWSGAVVVLTNEPSYWQRPGHGRATNADAFRIYECNLLTGVRVWGPNTGAGTRRGRELDLDLKGEYVCRWSDYSHLDGARGRFRILHFAVQG